MSSHVAHRLMCAIAVAGLLQLAMMTVAPAASIADPAAAQATCTPTGFPTTGTPTDCTPTADAAADGTTNRDPCATHGPHDDPADDDELAALGSADRRPSDPERSVRRLIGVRDPAACRCRRNRPPTSLRPLLPRAQRAPRRAPRRPADAGDSTSSSADTSGPAPSVGLTQPATDQGSMTSTVSASPVAASTPSGPSGDPTAPGASVVRQNDPPVNTLAPAAAADPFRATITPVAADKPLSRKPPIVGTVPPQRHGQRLGHYSQPGCGARSGHRRPGRGI